VETFRDATVADARAIWEINGDPSVRAASFSTREIVWSDHLDWLERVLGDPSRRLFVLEDPLQVLSVVRLDGLTSEVAEISIAVRSDQRGRGLGGKTLRQAEQICFAEYSQVQAIRALIKQDNRASQKTFQRVGYEFSGFQEVQGLEVREYLLERPAQS